jgi:hypothetical protein
MSTGEQADQQLLDDILLTHDRFREFFLDQRPTFAYALNQLQLLFDITHFRTHRCLSFVE